MERYTGEKVLTIHTQINSSDTKQKVKETDYLRFIILSTYERTHLGKFQTLTDALSGDMAKGPWMKTRSYMGRCTGEKVLTIHTQVDSSNTKQKVKETDYLRFERTHLGIFQILNTALSRDTTKGPWIKTRSYGTLYRRKGPYNTHSNKQLRHKTESERDQLSSIWEDPSGIFQILNNALSGDMTKGPWTKTRSYGMLHSRKGPYNTHSNKQLQFKTESETDRLSSI